MESSSSPCIPLVHRQLLVAVTRLMEVTGRLDPSARTTPTGPELLRFAGELADHLAGLPTGAHDIRRAELQRQLSALRIEASSLDAQALGKRRENDELGAQFIDGVAYGIRTAWGRLRDSVQELASGAADRPWPNENRVGRLGDMAPPPDSNMIVMLDGDNDVLVSIVSRRFGEPVMSDIEFCTPGAGGGKSPRTREALIALMVAMEQDNADPHTAIGQFPPKYSPTASAVSEKS